MTRKILLLLFPLLLLNTAVPAEGDYRRALPGYEFQFPRDHGSHPDFRTEWWYFTGNVATDSGRRFGYKLTFFRSALVPPGGGVEHLSTLASNQLYVAHFAISDFESRGHMVWERLGRPGLGQAGASTERLEVFNGDWRLEMDDEGAMTLRAPEGDFGIDLRLVPAKPFVIHGVDGAHQKTPEAGEASHYISHTRLTTTGTIRWQGVDHAITGLSWKDQEFGSSQLGEENIGWDWFAIQLDSGDDIMVFHLRRRDGTINPFRTGGWVLPDGTLVPLPGDAYTIRHTATWKSAKSGAVYPMGWEITFPSHDGMLVVTPVFEDQEMDTTRYTNTYYWEGAVTINGTWQGRPVSGRGYVELVGYAGDFNLL
jgi:predicted secreted hydrolase